MVVADRHFSEVDREEEDAGGATVHLYGMQVRSSQGHALSENISANKVLKEEDMEDREGEGEKARGQEIQSDRPEHPRRQRKSRQGKR